MRPSVGSPPVFARTTRTRARVECPCEHSIYTVVCNAKCTLVAPPRTILELAGRSTPQRWDVLPSLPVSTSLCTHCVPPPLWDRAHPSTAIVDSKLDSRCQNCTSRAPCGAWGAGGRDLDKIFEIGKGFVGLLETDWWNCSTTKCFKRGKR